LGAKQQRESKESNWVLYLSDMITREKEQKMKKFSSKLVALLLTLVLAMMMGSALVACGGGSNDSGANDAATSETAGNEDSTPADDAPTLLGPHTVDMTAEEMWATYKEFSSDKNLSEITLQDLEDLLGVDPEQQEGSATNNQYFWYSNDGGGLIVLFNKETGKFTSASQAYPK